MTAEQMVKAIFWYQAIGTVVAIIAGIVITFYQRRHRIERQQRRDEFTINRIDPPYRGCYESCACIDYTGRRCDHVITFDAFYNEWLKDHRLSRCYNFTLEGFMYDRPYNGNYCSPEKVGFASKRDVTCYRRWLYEQIDHMDNYKKEGYHAQG